MALRGAAAIACTTRGRNPFLSSTSHFFRLRFHHSPSHSLQRFTSYPSSQTASKNQLHAIQEASVDRLTPKKEYEKEQSPENWKIKMLYDGDCPLCMREVNMLKERNKQYGTIKFVDISSDEYSPQENQGLDYATVMGRIHAILSDGTVVTDIEAFRKLYEHVGLGWVYAITKYEPIATIADAVYGVWAKYRLQITGRPPLAEVLEARRKNKGEECGDNNGCKM
ncbi:Thiol-disulfide oxidoreductase DCC [Melia azedarach]|uniref:Thiol-disulfide oxidoreductase DCC n=1 Tax=Melia azedarach TaxID=155640 RepID=A0ACC1XLH8_MELAZ|nr:Thiol-disulfide oxidoreductase DCC [Melia azedarach]